MVLITILRLPGNKPMQLKTHKVRGKMSVHVITEKKMKCLGTARNSFYLLFGFYADTCVLFKCINKSILLICITQCSTLFTEHIVI